MKIVTKQNKLSWEYAKYPTDWRIRLIFKVNGRLTACTWWISLKIQGI